MSYQYLYKAIYDWVVSEMSGLIEPEKIIWEEQAMPRPQKPYISMKLFDNNSYGDDDPIQMAPGEYELRGQRRIMLSLSVYGIPPKNGEVGFDTLYAAEKLRSSTGKSDVASNFRSVNLAAQDTSQVRSATITEDNLFTPRHQLDVFFGNVFKTEDKPGYVEDVAVKNLDTDDEFVVET